MGKTGGTGAWPQVLEKVGGQRTLKRRLSDERLTKGRPFMFNQKGVQVRSWKVALTWL